MSSAIELTFNNNQVLFVAALLLQWNRVNLHVNETILTLLEKIKPEWHYRIQ